MKRLLLVAACLAAVSGAFAQAQCVRTEIDVSGNPVTLKTGGAKSTTWRDTYVYYERKHHRKHQKVYTTPGAMSINPSDPLLLMRTKSVMPVPEQYNVSVMAPDQNITVCEDSAAKVSAMLDVERSATYTGNYPVVKTEPRYVEISKRHYKVALRKKSKIERKEAKIARRANVNVDVKSAKD